jgi:6-pyruvoyl-tetrahydropterin synthase
MDQTSTTSDQPSASVIGDRNEVVKLFVRELTVLDYAYFDSERGVLGGSLDVDVTFVGLLDHEGVVFDFSLAKKAVKRVIDDLCDHRLVLPKKYVRSIEAGRVEVDAIYGKGNQLLYQCPEEGLCLLEAEDYSLAAMRSYLMTEVMKAMPENVDRVELDFRDEDLGEAPHYRYTHGLKQHYGNCQRLLHGHRNRVDVFIDGQRETSLESRVCDFWKDVHLGFPENIIESHHKVGSRQDDLESITLDYTSTQGKFTLTLPGKAVYVMPYETTVENISRHLRDMVQEWVGSERHVEVFAYEGIRKGSRSSTLED